MGLFDPEPIPVQMPLFPVQDVPTFAIVHALAPVPEPEPRRVQGAGESYRRWLDREWGKATAADKRIAKQYKDIEATNPIL